jgi:hypothetical protein
VGRSSTRTPGRGAGDWIILAGAGGYLAWTAVPHWYRGGGGKAFGIPLPSYTFNAWRGTTTFAALVALVAVAWVGLRRGGIRLWAGTDPSIVDLLLGTAGLALTLLGLALPPDTGVGTASVSWAFPVGIGLAVIWAFGAFRKYREHRSFARSASMPGSGFDGRVRP